jgi:hypothetical protein
MRLFRRAVYPAILIILLILLTACPGPPPGGLMLHDLGMRKGRFSYRIDMGSEPKDLIFIFGNPNSDDMDNGIRIQGGSLQGAEARAAQAASGLLAVSGRTGMKTALPDMPGLPRPDMSAFTERISARRVDASARALPKAVSAPNADYVGWPRLFNVHVFEHPASGPQPPTEVQATCQWISGENSDSLVSFPDGSQRKLSIWVANDQLEENSGPITADMVEAMAERFFGSPGSRGESIYAWVTAILGPEWGDTGEAGLVPFDRCISILVYDIDADESPNGGYIGYFDPSDTIMGAGSNERVMFYMDAPMFANADDPDTDITETIWSETAYWPGETFSTLAHEFQHMIAAYRISLLDGDYPPSWFNEMCSLAIEDLVADKLGVPGPRGVEASDYGPGPNQNEKGWIPIYNEYTSFGLSDYWFDYAEDPSPGYAISYSFGAYLLRNYGGAEFMCRLFEADGDFKTRLEAATGKVFKDLLARWPAAVLLSARQDAPADLRFNSGASFDSSVGGIQYRLGSINFYLYQHEYEEYEGGFPIGTHTQNGPYFEMAATLGDLRYIDAYSSIMYRAEYQQIGEKVFDIYLPRPLRVLALMP